MNDTLGTIGRLIETKLQAALHPSVLEVIDESNQHQGHVGAHPSGESHFRVRLSAAVLVGKSRIAQHRLVHEALTHELKTRVHALAIEVI